MLRNRVRTSTGALTVMLFLLAGNVIASPANAATTLPAAASIAPPVTSGVDQVTLKPQQQVEINALAAASDYKSKRFLVQAAVKGGAGASSIADFAAVLRDQGWTVVGSVTAQPSTLARQSIAAAIAACKGKNGYNGYYFPWGWQFGLNSCNTNKLIAGVGLGAAGAVVVTAALVAGGATATAAPIAGLVAAVIGFGAAALRVCQAFSSNGGIWLNVGGTPQASCWGQ